MINAIAAQLTALAEPGRIILIDVTVLHVILVGCKLFQLLNPAYKY